MDDRWMSQSWLRIPHAPLCRRILTFGNAEIDNRPDSLTYPMDALFDNRGTVEHCWDNVYKSTAEQQ